MSLAAELDGNFNKFSGRFDKELASVRVVLGSHRKLFLESYIRIASLNAWREQLFKTVLSEGSLAFFLEAQNDALMSHVLARFGSWRAANQMLRNFLESAVQCLYFKDHPIELQQWLSGRFKLGFSATITYLEKHPDILPVHALSGLANLQREYKTLCMAVHGAATFRMTNVTTGTKLWEANLANLGKWATRENAIIQNVNCLLLTMFRMQLQGARMPALREILAYVIAPSKFAAIKSKLSVVL